MERKKLMFFTSVSASVLLASALLVACTAAEATGPGESVAASSLLQVESVSGADSSAPASSSQSTSRSTASQSSSASTSRPASSSSATSSSVSSEAPAQSAPQQAAPQAQALAQQSECEPEPAPAPAPEPAPAPAPSVNIDGCLSAAAGWASGSNMAVNDALYIGGAGYESPIDTSGKTDAQVTEHLMYQLGLIHGQLTAMPEFDPGTTYPCYKFVVDGSLIYVLYG